MVREYFASIRSGCEHTFLTHPDYIREKARRLRVERNLSIDEIAERLALPRITIYYWVRDLPLGRPRRVVTPAQRGRNNSNRRRYRELREAAYREGLAEYPDLSRDPHFRDFVCMYIGEGYKKCRNVVSIANSDATVIRLADHFLRRFSRNPVRYSLQYHADQDFDQLRVFWRRILGNPNAEIRFQRKSNSGQLNGRNWRSRHGVLTVCASDTYLRSRLQAWIDCIQWSWLQFTEAGV
jgi:hypothetical protein